MKILVTGCCGFAGFSLLQFLAESSAGSGRSMTLYGIDNLTRIGSEQNRSALKQLGVEFVHGDLRLASDLESLPGVDWVIDAAANPSVLAGVDGKSSSRQTVEHNLIGTINLLEYCRRCSAGLLLLSTSRVYSIRELSALPVSSDSPGGTDRADALQLVNGELPHGVTSGGITEAFSTSAPISLYGGTKLASEVLALEYHSAFGLPVWINRCGILAGPGQFGRPDQGIIAFWIHSWLARRALRYIGFGGQGHQVRDCLHPRDLGELLLRQMVDTSASLTPGPQRVGRHRVGVLAEGTV